MPNEHRHHAAPNDLDPRDRLACERTLLAYERTQIAWVRTALALISFGFVITQFFNYLLEQRHEIVTLLSPSAVGQTMIIIALISLSLATWRHQRAVKLLRYHCPDLPAPIGGHVLASMIALLGVLALLADRLR